MVLCSLKGKSLPYRKPGQTGKVKQPSYNTLTGPYQPWSTNIYNKGQQEDSLNTEHYEMILSWETLAYNWIIAEVFHSDEEFDNPTCSWFVWLMCLIDTGLVKKKTGFTKWCPKKCSFDLICNSSMRSVFRETTPIYGI